MKPNKKPKARAGSKATNVLLLLGPAACCHDCPNLVGTGTARIAITTALRLILRDIDIRLVGINLKA